MTVIVQSENRVVIAKPPPPKVLLIQPPAVRTVKVQPPRTVKVLAPPERRVVVQEVVKKVIIKRPTGVPGPQGPPGPPGTGGAQYLAYQQSTPAASWHIVHNFQRVPQVVLLDLDGNEMISDITHNSNNDLTIVHAEPVAGTAHLSA